MTVTKRGSVWFGSESGDLDAYLQAYEAGGYPVSRVKHATCAMCNARSGFFVKLDDEAGVAVRECVSCASSYVMLDGAEFLE